MHDALEPVRQKEAGCSDIVIACCRDEADIITDFIDFYLDQGFDRICLIDNGSTDGTVEQILSHPRQDRILMLRDARLGYDIRLLDYHNMFVDAGVRWVFFLDIDEFVPLPGGIKAFAGELPPAVTLLELPTAEMQPNLNSGVVSSPLLSSRREARFAGEGAEPRPLEFKMAWKAVDVQKIFCGKHDVVLEPRVPHCDERVYIRHFHTRSQRQFARKLANRIQTEEAMGAHADNLTLFSGHGRKAWLAQSYRLLEPDGWSLEARRLAELNTVSDTAVADWACGRRDFAEELDISPFVPLGADREHWFCGCVRGFRASEGHTGSEHLILFHAPGWTLASLERPFSPGDAAVPVRLHSECLLGDIFSSSRCDCGYQLANAIEAIEEAGGGVIVYLRQEGRGVGLMDKLRSLAVDHEDTFRRNEIIGLPGDMRGYRMSAEILKRLGVARARLLSGNGAKADALRKGGIETLLDGKLPLNRIPPEAVSEIYAKLQKGYSYDLVGSPAPLL